MTISGHLRAHDGGALSVAELRVLRYGFAEPVAAASLDAEGRFRVEVPPGLYHVMISAADHARAWRTSVVQGGLHVEGRLGTYPRADPSETVRLRAEWIDAKGEVIGPGPSEATRTQAGMYRVAMLQRPPDATQLRYQLVAEGGGRTTNGPIADALVSDGGGDFWSVVDLAEREMLELDLRDLPPAGVAAALEWRGEPERTRALADFITTWQGPIGALHDAVRRVDGKISTITTEDRRRAAALDETVRQEIAQVHDAELRTLLEAARISLFASLLVEFDDPAWRRRTLEWALARLPPDDVHFGFFQNVDRLLVTALREADPALVTRAEAWLERRAADNPEPGLAIEALTVLVDQAERRGDEARTRELYATSHEPRFEGSLYREFLRLNYDPDRTLQRGRPLPSFDFAGLDGGRIVSGERVGRLYLLEFWATWCAPCVMEMPKLHEAYAKLNGARAKPQAKGSGLRRLGEAKSPRVEFVFVSFDAAPEDVAEFRKQHWSMPWTHAFVGSAGDKDVMKQFGFGGVPTAILVDERGTIVEVGEALRGDALASTLERVLAERSGESR